MNILKKLRCGRGVLRPCNRKPRWLIGYLGMFCNFHFEAYLTTHTVDPVDIKRLSGNGDDFVIQGKSAGERGGKQSIQAVHTIRPEVNT